jgi:hypothetical protein
MRVAARTILLPLHPLRVQALVLRGEVVSILTLAARENDFVSRHFNCRVEGTGLRAEGRCAALRAAKGLDVWRSKKRRNAPLPDTPPSMLHPQP